MSITGDAGPAPDSLKEFSFASKHRVDRNSIDVFVE